ncbi:hypothetical protein STEG23_023211 [Scotinomys teguina]
MEREKDMQEEVKASHLGKKLPMPQLLTVCCPRRTNRTQKKVTAELCQEKVLCLHVCLCTTCECMYVPHTHGYQKKIFDSLELEVVGSMNAQEHCNKRGTMGAGDTEYSRSRILINESRSTV